MEGDFQDTAQVCLNGDLIDASYHYFPEGRRDFCPECGAKTITACPRCQADIPGTLHMVNAFVGGTEDVPRFCHKCGAPYPWSEASLQAAKELAELSALGDDDRRLLGESVDDLVRDTPRTPVATERFKRLMKKAGPQVADSFRSVLVDVVSETVRKAIWGPTA